MSINGKTKSGEAILTHSQSAFLLGVLILTAVIRLGTLGVYPLTDNTEARYAEVAKEMVVSGQWITPRLHGIKFWSKPPLSIWATALSIKIFGENEFAARLGPLVPSLVVIWLVYALAACRYGRDPALMTALILSSTVLFFVGSGAVMTDAMLTLGTTLSMVAFWRALDTGETRKRMWGYLFFVGLAIGLLAKGPVGPALTAIPIFLWMIWKKRFKDVWLGLPWVGGTLLACAIALPWYLAAEARTPGFINYFIIGEHWKRFTQPGWTGDLYGSAHSQPRGMIWLFWVLAAFPWSLGIIGYAAGRPLKFVKSLSNARHAGDWPAYLFLWALSPMLLFTMAGNILWTYVLPGLPALALLIAGYWRRSAVAAPKTGAETKNTTRVIALGAVIPIIFCILVSVWFFVPFKASQKPLVTIYLSQRPSVKSRLVYLLDRPYSAEFYSSGDAVVVNSFEELQRFQHNGVTDFYAIKRKELPGFPADIRQRLVKAGSYDGYLLLKDNGDFPAKDKLTGK